MALIPSHPIGFLAGAGACFWPNARRAMRARAHTWALRVRREIAQRQPKPQGPLPDGRRAQVRCGLNLGLRRQAQPDPAQRLRRAVGGPRQIADPQPLRRGWPVAGVERRRAGEPSNLGGRELGGAIDLPSADIRQSDALAAR
jgi:hypothetical protein